MSVKDQNAKYDFIIIGGTSRVAAKMTNTGISDFWLELVITKVRGQY